MSNIVSAAESLVSPGPPVQDFIILNGQKSPGRATLKGAALDRSWDSRKGYGISGASTIYTGDNLSEFECELAIGFGATQADIDAQWDDWNAWSTLLSRPPATKDAQALSIVHPILNRKPLNITAVVVKHVTQFEEDDQGLFVCTITFLQYRAPKTALAKPQSTPAAAVAQPTAQDAAEQMSQQLSAQSQYLDTPAGGNR